MLKLMLITNCVDVAKYAVECGVDRIFIDCERLNKAERQAGFDTLISAHDFDDIAPIRKAVPNATILVRTNPLHSGTQEEVEKAITAGADWLMLPMLRTADDMATFNQFVKKRVPTIPLIETPEALSNLKEIARVEGVGEIFIGLNDLHLGLGLKFMFEPLGNGLLDEVKEIAKEANLPFGFGGIARIGEGLLPAEMILSEHVRLGSSSVILSRTFHGRSENLSDLQNQMDLQYEINKLRAAEKMALTQSGDDLLQVHRDVFQIIENIKQG